MRRAVLMLAALAGCGPVLPAPTGRVEGPRLIAALAEPPEVAPGEGARLRAFIAADGPDAPEPEWALCADPAPITELGPIAAACLSGDAATTLGSGRSIDLSVGFDACQIYGPDPLKPEQRPRDPDPSGGYYLPLVIRFGDQVAALRLRLSCDLAQLPVQLSRELRARQARNQNPRAAGIEGTGTLTLGLEAGAKETYLVPTPSRDALTEVEERLEASWFWEGPGELNPTRAAPEEPIEVRGDVVRRWVVLRDDRGGASVHEGP